MLQDGYSRMTTPINRRTRDDATTASENSTVTDQKIVGFWM
jgi:hypothetical protein